MYFMAKFKILFLIIFFNANLQEINTQKACPPQEAILPCRCLLRGKDYQIWCSHTNLSKVLQSLKAIGQYVTTPIDELILENNYLPSLPDRTFGDLKILRVMLRYNALERVSADWLAGLEDSLMELFIVEPKLNLLPQSSIEQLKNLKAVTLRSKLLKRLPMFSGLPLLRYLQIESQALTEISPNNFKDNPTLEKLHIQFSPRLHRLEANLFDDLPKLELINITNCGLNWVHPRAFSRLPDLRELVLIGNKITDPGMIGRASRELPKLEVLRLDYNYIGTLYEASFVDIPAIKHIYLSHNVIGEIKMGAFHRLTSLKTLDLSKNMLRRIQRQSFLQPIALEELNLRDNDITDVVQVRSILEDLPKLVYLDVSYNMLEAIPFGSLKGHSSLEQLNLGFNRLRFVDKEAFMVMPALRELVLTNNSISENLRVPFWNLPALKGLDVSKNHLRRLEHYFLANIEGLRRIDLSLNHLNFIDPEAFLATQLLEHINLSFNGIKILHPATFRHLTQLYELDVSSNHLKVLVSGLPGTIEHLHLRQNEISKISAADLQLPSLRLLDLSENKIQSLEQGQLRALGRLKKLYLKNNFLRRLDENSLDGLLQLEVLDVSDNRISDINPHAMKSVIELKILNLSSNQLNLIGPAMLTNAKHLKKFDASQNQLAEILPNTFSANSNIGEIDLSSNLLVQFPDTLYDLAKVKKLDLSENRLKNINATILSSLVNLREIKLSKNFIQILEAESFNHLKHLKTIFLDDNDVMLVEPNFIKMMPVLKSVKLNKNKIEELPSHAFNTLLSLQSVELQENKIRFLDAHAFHLVPQLLTLNLSNNEITKIDDAGLKSMRSLELLDMSFNKIMKMTPNLNDLEWLVELRMKNNYICEVEEGVLNNMPRLKVLDLRNNKLVVFPEVALERLRENTAQLDVRGNPLDCSCDMLWLKSWLRETSQASPTCSDGILLREMPLTVQDCPAENLRDKSFSGCDTELLNAPNFQHPQMFSKYTNFRNISLNGQNNLAPSPQESEYFYDDYIDYPFNSSVVDPSGYLTDKIKAGQFTERVPLAIKQPGENTTGNTPVLYAAPSKKKPKPDIPQKVPDSPSTSGFTFFGIPLPPLNINNIFGKNVKNVDQPTPQQNAERKNAIMNKPRNEKRQPMPKMGERFPQQPQQTASGPELQGGFMPILPGYGGFKPIPDPYSTTYSSLTSTVSTTTVANQRIFEEELEKPNDQNEEEETEPEVSEKPLQNTLDQKNYNLETVSNKTSLVISADSDSTVNNRNKKSQFVEEEGKVNGTRLEIKENNVHFFNKSEVHIVQELPSNKSLSGLEKTEIKQTKATIAFTQPTTEPTTSTTSAPIKMAVPATAISQMEDEVKAGMETQIKVIEENIPLSTTSSPKIVNEGRKFVENENRSSIAGSSLSTLLAPGGQQPYFKPTAKSTITKVASPHGSSSSPLLSNLELSDNLEKIPLEDPIVTSTEDSRSNDWYFENYNKKDLEPFVQKIVNGNLGNGIAGNKLVIGVLWFLIMVYG